jgi:serine protease Do
MSRRFALVTVCLTAVSAFLVGLIVAGALVPTTARSHETALPVAARTTLVAAGAGAINFADIAERLNPSVVNLDATSRGHLPAGHPPLLIGPDSDSRDGEMPDVPRRGTGSGFVIDPEGYILTNQHVIDRADRITVKLSDGRNLRARLVGADPETDIALIKVEPSVPLAVAPLGNSDSLRVGEWVCAIGNPLAYEHSVTVGVVSYIGRKLFDSSLDNYIQTDAAINFGNSGGPLINGRGEVIGINAAISSRASNIGFAVPVNQATAILPQLRDHGRVSRGFIGVALKDVDPDLQRSLALPTAHGALVQDVTAGSPGDRAGLRAYDLIVGVDGVPTASNDELIRHVSAKAPGALVRLDVVRDGRPLGIAVRLGQRPGRDGADRAPSNVLPEPASGPGTLGLSVKELDREFRDRFKVPATVRGVVVTRVEPMSPAFDADIERGVVVLEINRREVSSVAEFERATRGAHPGDVLAFYLYSPDGDQRTLRAVRIDAP